MASECWLWPHSVDKDGYGLTTIEGHRFRVHRLAYESFCGPIPVDRVVDHLCHTESAKRGECLGGKCEHRKCFNPSHLRLVTRAQNSSDQVKKWRNRCSHGHEYTPENTLRKKSNNSRICRICRDQWNKIHNAKAVQSGYFRGRRPRKGCRERDEILSSEVALPLL